VNDGGDDDIMINDGLPPRTIQEMSKSYDYFLAHAMMMMMMMIVEMHNDHNLVATVSFFTEIYCSLSKLASSHFIWSEEPTPLTKYHLNIPVLLA
jgi:hypothetical protein